MSLAVGDRIVLAVERVGAQGVCVARLDGQVVFVRHTLPGERVAAVVTEVRRSYARADAVEVIDASPDRVEPPCPYAGPGRCGGCDWQHVSRPAQRALKAEVVAEQLRRLAGVDTAVEVEPLPGGLLGWRDRISYAVDAAGRPGLHRSRAGGLEYVDRCLLGAPGVGNSQVLSRTWPGLNGIEVVQGDDGERAVIAHRPAREPRSRGRQRPPDRRSVIEGPRVLTRRVGEHRLRVSATGFWQGHPAAVAAYAQALREFLEPRPGEHVLELYSGAGAFTVGLAEAVGAQGTVSAVEADGTAVGDARANLARFALSVTVHATRVTGAAVREIAGPGVDLVVLDPPRAGAGEDVMRAVDATGARAVAYIACEPAPLARDVATLRQLGWELSGLRAFDAFPMTHHVECVAVLRRPRS